MLNFRLRLLKDSGQIGEKTFEQLNRFVPFLEERTGIVLTEDNAAMLITHFAIALERACRDEPVNAMEKGTLSQVTASHCYPQAESLLEAWTNSDNLPVFHDNERDFLLLHLCVLLASPKPQNENKK